VRRFPVKTVVAVCSLALLCATPLASAMPDRIGRALDSLGPTIGVPADITAAATGSAGALVTYTVTFDDPDGVATSGCTPPSGDVFPVGTTLVTCNATDTLGNASSASFNVTVTPPPDTTAPTISVPANFSVEATSSAGAAASYSVSFTDPDDAVATSGCTPVSGSTFSLGPNTVTCNATDSHGNIAAAATFTITVVDTTGPVFSNVPGTVTREATSTAGASATYTDPTATDAVTGTRPVVCAPASGSTFAIGTTPVQCTTSDGTGNNSTAAFNVVVQDTTPPVIDPATVPANISHDATSPSGYVASFTTPSATDLGASAPVSCLPASGSTFPVGDTTVTCKADDGRGNTSSVSFHVIIAPFDTTAPSIGVPTNITVEAHNNASSASVSYSVSFTDPDDAVTASSCVPASGSSFPVGTTTVNCTATDAHSNTSSRSFNVTVRMTPPLLVLPAGITAEATGPDGAAVSYSFSASDPDDAVASSSCAPASGSTFHLGSNTVTCTATDTNGNHSSNTFTVTVRDTTGPTFTGIPSGITVEANSPTGSIVNFPSIIGAVDLVDGPIVGNPCAPASGTTFPLGTTVVNCNATDAHGNTGHAAFNITVADTTPPNLIVPVARSVYATTPTGIPNTVSGIVSFLSGASASDIVDPSPVVTNNAPAFLPVGNQTITFGARDASGNATFKDVTLIVLPQPPPGTPPLPIPSPPKAPAEVTNVKVTPLDGAARIQWNAGGRQVMVTRSSSSTRSLSAIGDQVVVYTGTASSYVDRGLQNGVEYRYVVTAVDAAGNHSAGVAAVIVPRRNLLKSPKDGARLRKAPKLTWALDSEAAYYNAQLLVNGKKILSVWPTSPAFAVKKTWKYEGRKYTLAPGLYTWFVWPGYGARSAVDYGELMGSRTFRIVR
jgi:large repetitive protein